MLSAGAHIELRCLTRRYGDGRGIASVDLDVAPGELLAITGPSGSGKSTLVRIVAGLEAPDAGAVIFDGRDVTRLAPHERRVGMTFDDGALYEHLDVRRNVEAGLDRAGLKGDAARSAARDAIRLVGAEHLFERRPETLSAGERRRVALARAIARKPALLLLDEPLTHLDRAARLDLREDLCGVQQALGATTLLVTHDHEDAIAIADRIAFLSEGRVRQIGVASDLLDRPVHVDVARGFGPWPMNLVPAPDGGTIGFRPEHATTRTAPTDRTVGWSVDGVVAHRGGKLLTVRLDDGSRVRLADSADGQRTGERVSVGVELRQLHRFSASGDRIDSPQASA